MSPDSLSLFPNEPEAPALAPVPEARRVSPDLVKLDPMIRTMQARLSALEADLEQLRELAGRVADEHRRIEHARLEASHSLKTRERMLLNEPPYVVQGDVVADETLGPPRFELARRSHHQWNPRRLRDNTTALVTGMIPRPVRVRWPRFVTPGWLSMAPRHAGDYAAATGAFALLVIAALMISPGEGSARRDLPPVPAIARLEPLAAPAAPSDVPPSRSPVTRIASEAALAGTSTETLRPAADRLPHYVGSLSVLSEPAGASVFVNREYVGETPLRIPRVRAGSHVVWVEGDGYRRWTDSVLVPADKVTKVNVNLERSPDGQR